jgi:hypothetical protein
MSRNRLLTCAAVALAAALSVPAAAQAGAGPGDDTAQAISPDTQGGFLPLSTASQPHILGFDIPDTSNYTTEPGEPLRCASSGTTYAKTAWGVFKAPQYGRVSITAAGFDSVITLLDATTNRIVKCTDRLLGKIEQFPNDSLPTVKKNHVYGVQLGGAVQADGSFAGGGLTVNMELIRPATTVADAVLTWVSAGGGVKIKSLRVTPPRGSVITLGCLKKSCGKVRSFSVSKTVFGQKISSSFVSRLGAGGFSLDRTSADAPVRMAAKPNLNGKRIKNGDTLVVAIQGEDQIGVVYVWQVKRGAAGSKIVGCREPNFGAIRLRVGSCTGK